MRHLLSLLITASLAFGASAQEITVGALLPRAQQTVVRTEAGVLQYYGGISGMAWDGARGELLLLSDDRNLAPTRFYIATLDLSRPDGLRVQQRVDLLQPDGSTFPRRGQSGVVPDPEALCLDDATDTLFWTSEGDVPRGQHPFLRIAARDGRHLGELPLPPQFRVDPTGRRGVRDNLSLEGLSCPDAQGAFWLAMEAPFIEDGPVPTLEHGGLARLSRLARDGRLLAQYAYPLDPVQRAPSGGQRRGDNGISEILGLGAGRLLVVERSGHEVAPQQFRFAVRIYEASSAAATDIAAIPSLQGARYQPMRKRLLLDLNEAGLGTVDNIEAAAWGPLLANGHRTLLLHADDNFSPPQVNQFLVFEVLP